jgi:hypothetical protein
MHARSLKLFPQEKLDKWNKNIGGGRNGVVAKEKAIKDKILDIKPVAKTVEEKEAKEIYSLIIQDKDFDLGEMVAQKFEEIGEDLYKIKRYCEGLFVSWHFADVKTRKPQTLKEVAILLRVPEVRIREWFATDWLSEKMKDRRNHIQNLFLPIVDRSMIIQAIAGDKSAQQQFYKQLGPIVVDPDKNRISVDPKFMEKCENTSESTAINLDEDTKDVHENILKEE